MLYRRAPRSGQANVISLLILVSITVTLAIGLYAYFTGLFASQSENQAVLNGIADYATGLQVTVLYTSNYTASTSDYLYCVIVSLHDIHGNPLHPYVVLLPVDSTVNNLLWFNSSVRYVPVNTAINPPVNTEYAWQLEDADKDGIVEMLGGSITSPIIASQTVLSCSDIYANSSVTQIQLSYTETPAGKVILNPTGPITLNDQLAKALGTTPSNYNLISWGLPLNGTLNTVNLYFYIDSPVPLSRLDLVVFAPINDKLYYASSTPVMLVK